MAPEALAREVQHLLGQRRAREAVAAADALVRRLPAQPEPQLLVARARQQLGDFAGMLDATRAALALAPGHVGARLQQAEALLLNGRRDECLAELADIERSAGGDSRLLQHLGEFYAHAGRHDTALACYERAVELAPDDARTLYNLASAQIASGDLTAAERNFDRVIELDPGDCDAWHNRSTLRRQTPESNHIAALSAMLERGPRDAAGEVQLCYALAKENEDLGEHDVAFAWLARGAARRRALLQYRVDGDVAVMDRLRGLFDSSFAARVPAATKRRGPLFVLGLPRSGTTLVDRILSSHSRVASLGEINDFAFALTRLAGTADKAKLLDASVALDMDELGAAYVDSTRRAGYDAELLIDKTPSNYLYLGLIAKALPGAVVVHVRRHPVDSCLAMYRTLFRMGYPFTYDLDDLGRYYVAWHRLMQHWRETFPGVVYDVDYEALVAEPERVSRELVAHCGLDWEATCLDFDRNRAPVATASAAQVRQPIYRDSVARWRRYEKQLAPLVQRLRDAGIAV